MLIRGIARGDSIQPEVNITDCDKYVFFAGGGRLVLVLGVVVLLLEGDGRDGNPVVGDDATGVL